MHYYLTVDINKQWARHKKGTEVFIISDHSTCLIVKCATGKPFTVEKDEITNSKT